MTDTHERYAPTKTSGLHTPASHGNDVDPLDPRLQAVHDHPVISRSAALVFSTACGLAVANVYFAQPLLDTMSDDVGISRSVSGIVITMTQVGYGVGLLLIVPLGDLLRRRQLIIAQLTVSLIALLVVSLARNATALLFGVTAMGALAVVAQTLLAYAAALASPEHRGRIVGSVTTGIIIGILLARTMAGLMSDHFGWRSIYIASAIATLGVVLLLFRIVPHEPRRQSGLTYSRLIWSMFTLFRDETILRTRAVLALLIFSAITVLLTPIVLSLTGPPYFLTHTEVGLFGLAGVAGVLGAKHAGQLADRGQAERTTAIGLAVMLLGWLLAAFLPVSLWALVLGVILMDYGLQSVHVSNQSLILRVRPEARSRLTAGYMIFYAIGCAAGSIGSTVMFDAAGWAGVCILGGTISSTALIFWWLTRQPEGEVL